ncbi:MAG TPA: tetratricopeptide repeat protein [Balneolales bacterium]|nr:tetratricopeptide repeat protein [Balneolales bacterium]
MSKYLKPAIAAIAALFVLYACQASNPNIQSAKTNLKNKNYQKALTAAQAAIKADSTNPEAYYYKGYVLSKMADAKPNPSARTQLYKQMSQAYSHAKKLYASNGKKKNTKETYLIRMSLVQHWTQEHNAAIKLVTGDSAKAPGHIQKAIAHLKNATVIEPDSLLSYEVLSEVYYMNHDVKNAAKTLHEVIQKNPKVKTKYYLQLANFYNQDKNYDEAINTLQQAKQQYPDSIKVIQQLANTYLTKGDDHNAIQTVASLIQNDPQNPQYRLVYGTEIYKLVLNVNDSLTSNYNKIFNLKQKLKKTNNKQEQNNLKNQISQIEQQNQQLHNKIDKQTSKAEVQLKKVIQLKPKEDVAYHTLGVIYQNKAAALIKERNNTDDNKKANELDQQARKMLQKALPYYKKATELKPKNKNYWRSLFRVYTNLGMNKKAQEAMKKAGMSN